MRGKRAIAVVAVLVSAGCSAPNVNIPPVLPPVGMGSIKPAEPPPTPVAPSKEPVARTSFGDKPDGTPPASEDTGQPVSHTGSAASVVASGQLTMEPPTSGGAGMYREFDAGQPITRMGARFTLGSKVVGTTDNSAVGLVIENERLDISDPAMRLNIHFYVGATNWGIQSFVGGVWNNHATGTFNPPLKIDSTVYTAEISCTAGTVTIVLPDGQIKSVKDPAFANAGDWGYVETAMTAPTDNIPGIVEYWWDVGDQQAPR
jgi:hypothetical protein